MAKKKATKKATPRKAAKRAVKKVTPKSNGKTQGSPVVTNTSQEPQRVVDNSLAMVLNQLAGRRLGLSNFLEEVTGSNRDYNKECGYPETGSLTVGDFYKPFYERHPIANRVVEVYPVESWKVTPAVYETEDVEQVTPFEESWDQLVLSLMGESHYKTKEGNPIWRYLRKVDILSGIGHFGVLFLGLDDGLELHEPAEPREGQQLLFLRAFDEECVDITRYDSEPTSPRFGMPERYSITFSSPELTGGIGAQSVTKDVHWSRVIHVADNTTSNEVVGTPRQRPVFDRLWDLRKIYGSDAEGYWLGAFMGLAFSTHPQLGGKVQLDKTQFREEIQDYMEGLQRFLLLKGMDAESLAPQVADPVAHIDIQIDAICVQLACPKRVFLGSERGELASSQDAGAWNDRLCSRHNTYLTPDVIVPLIDRLIMLGVLVEPADGYEVEWPDLESMSTLEKAEVAMRDTESLAKYVAGDVRTVVPPMEYLTKVLKWTKEEAEAALESAVADFDDQIEQDLKRQEAFGLGQEQEEQENEQQPRGVVAS